MQLAGAAKFPYLSLEHRSLDLGRVIVGHSSTVQLRVANRSPVEAHFRVEAQDAAAAAGLPPVAGAAGGLEQRAFEVSPRE